MTSRAGRSGVWRAWTAALALISAVLLVLSYSGERSASAQTPPDPIARAWGINSFGQLGDDSFAPRNKQVEVKGEGGVGSLGNVSSLDGGQNHTVALKNGTAYAWGHNGSGQLGTGPVSGTGADSDVPVQVHGAGDVGFLTDVVAIAAGSAHSLAVKSDGTVWAWGYDGFGQLGDSTSHAGNLSRTPVQVQGVGGSGFLTSVSSVAGGGLHSLALKSDGTVYAWGYNGTGGLGNNGGPDSSTPVQVKGVGGVGSLGGVTSVAAGSEHSLAVKSDGTLWAWGNNFNGQVGDGTSGNQRNTPVQVRDEIGTGFLTGVTSAAAGARHTLATVGPHGTVWA